MILQYKHKFYFFVTSKWFFLDLQTTFMVGLAPNKYLSSSLPYIGLICTCFCSFWNTNYSESFNVN
jgi:hypothetical protein